MCEEHAANGARTNDGVQLPESWLATILCLTYLEAANQILRDGLIRESTDVEDHFRTHTVTVNLTLDNEGERMLLQAIREAGGSVPPVPGEDAQREPSPPADVAASNNRANGRSSRGQNGRTQAERRQESDRRARSPQQYSCAPSWAGAAVLALAMCPH